MAVVRGPDAIPSTTSSYPPTFSAYRSPSFRRVIDSHNTDRLAKVKWVLASMLALVAVRSLDINVTIEDVEVM